MTPRSFRYDESGAVATITLDRQESLNALTFEVYRELTETFRGLAGRPGVRAVVLTGTGRAFCTGGDVKDIIGHLVQRDRSALLEFTRLTCDLVRAMCALPRPIVASLNGTVAGAGAILAMASDLRLGTPRSRVAFLFTRVGLSGADMGACAILPRIIGQGRASELLYTGRFLEAEEAERWGFYNRIVPPESLQEEAAALARSIAQGPTFAHAMTKRQLHHEWGMGVDEAIEAEAQAQAICMQTEDFARAFRAFAAKEKPVFEGN